MVTRSEGIAIRYGRRGFIKKLAAAGFAATVIASIIADGTWAQDAASPVANAYQSLYHDSAKWRSR